MFFGKETELGKMMATKEKNCVETSEVGEHRSNGKNMDNQVNVTHGIKLKLESSILMQT